MQPNLILLPLSICIHVMQFHSFNSTVLFINPPSKPPYAVLFAWHSTYITPSNPSLPRSALCYHPTSTSLGSVPLSPLYIPTLFYSFGLSPTRVSVRKLVSHSFLESCLLFRSSFTYHITNFSWPLGLGTSIFFFVLLTITVRLLQLAGRHIRYHVGYDYCRQYGLYYCTHMLVGLERELFSFTCLFHEYMYMCCILAVELSWQLWFSTCFCVLRNCVDYSNSNGLEPVSNLYSGLGRLMLQDELRLQLFWRFTYVFGRISDGTQIPWCRGLSLTCGFSWLTKQY
jgi:hypothetical protein